MNIQFGSQTFKNVQVPVLWGQRAIIAHPNGKLSIIDLSGSVALPEIVADTPWTNIEFSEKEDGFIIFKNDDPLYFFSPRRRLIRDMKGTLPECQITNQNIRIGSNTIASSMISGSQVGIGISENGFFIGGPMPSELAELKV